MKDTARERAKVFASRVFMLADWARKFAADPNGYNHERLIEAALDLAQSARKMEPRR